MSQTSEPLSEPLTIVAFGDSITVGSKASQPRHRWVDVLHGLLLPFLHRPLHMVNAGLGDNTISPRSTSYEHASKPSALERLERDVLAHRPDVVLVCFGLNDMRFGTPVDVFAHELGVLLEHIRRALPATTVVVTNVFHMTGYDRYRPRDRGSPTSAAAYDQAIARVAAQGGALLADVSGALARRDALVHEDGVHGLDLAHRLIAHRVFEVLAGRTALLASVARDG